MGLFGTGINPQVEERMKQLGVHPSQIDQPTPPTGGLLSTPPTGGNGTQMAPGQTYWQLPNGAIVTDQQGLQLQKLLQARGTPVPPAKRILR